MVQNVLDPELSRYINVEEELAAWLERKYRAAYGSDHDFDVTHWNDRYYFQLRDQLTQKELQNIINVIVDERKEAKKRAEREAALAAAAAAEAGRN